MRCQPMHPHDFSSALAEAGLSCVDFSAISNISHDRITRMMLGLERVTYEASLLVTLLTVRQARELAIIHSEIEPEGEYIEPNWSPGFLEGGDTA